MDMDSLLKLPCGIACTELPENKTVAFEDTDAARKIMNSHKADGDSYWSFDLVCKLRKTHIHGFVSHAFLKIMFRDSIQSAKTYVYHRLINGDPGEKLGGVNLEYGGHGVFIETDRGRQARLAEEACAFGTDIDSGEDLPF